MNNIIRFGVSIDEKLLNKFDIIIDEKGYVNRSEAIRDLIRGMMENNEISESEAVVIGTLTLVYSHNVHELADKLNDIQHHHHKSIISTTHIHLDEHNCLEVMILRGKSKDVQEIADRLISIKNVKHGKLTVTAALEE